MFKSITTAVIIFGVAFHQGCSSKRINTENDNIFSFVRGICDPHIETFDGINYVFNLAGEYWMIQTSDQSFSMQARLEPYRKATSVFTAFVMEQNDGKETTKVQILRDLRIFVDDQEISYLPNPGEIIQKRVEISYNQHEDAVTLKFSLGYSFTFYHRVGGMGQEFLSVIGLVANSVTTVGRRRTFGGLWGKFDLDGGSNDLTIRNGTTIIPTTATMEEINLKFGASWQINCGSESESLFLYENGEECETLGNYAGYQPNLEYPDFSKVPEKIVRACGGVRECLFDFLSTGDFEMAMITKELIEKYEVTKKIFGSGGKIY